MPRRSNVQLLEVIVGESNGADSIVVLLTAPSADIYVQMSMN
jgi:carboxylesterase type B